MVYGEIGLRLNLNSILIATLISARLYLSLKNLGYLSFWTDEYSHVFAALGILEVGKPQLPNGKLYWRAILNTLFVSLSFKLFGISEFSARFSSAIFGALSILVCYLFGRELKNPLFGLIASAILTFDLWSIEWARLARMYAQFQFFYLLTLYLFYLFLKKGGKKWFSLTLISFTFSVLSHRLAFTLLPSALLSYLFYKGMESLEKRKFFILIFYSPDNCCAENN
ncbi:MAG: glycosyltransferase family 39 protein, partial [Candidatus Methanofastidiosia archaeon]